MVYFVRYFFEAMYVCEVVFVMWCMFGSVFDVLHFRQVLHICDVHLFEVVCISEGAVCEVLYFFVCFCF